MLPLSIVNPRTSEVSRTSAIPSSTRVARHVSTASGVHPSSSARELNHVGGWRFTTHGGGAFAEVGLFHFCEVTSCSLTENLYR